MFYMVFYLNKLEFDVISINPDKPGLFWRLGCPGSAPPPLQISAVDRAIAEWDVNYKTVLLDYSILLFVIVYFI